MPIAQHPHTWFLVDIIIAVTTVPKAENAVVRSRSVVPSGRLRQCSTACKGSNAIKQEGGARACRPTATATPKKGAREREITARGTYRRLQVVEVVHCSPRALQSPNRVTTHKHYRGEGVGTQSLSATVRGIKRPCRPLCVCEGHQAQLQSLSGRQRQRRFTMTTRLMASSQPHRLLDMQSSTALPTQAVPCPPPFMVTPGARWVRRRRP